MRGYKTELLEQALDMQLAQPHSSIGSWMRAGRTDSLSGDTHRVTLRVAGECVPCTACKPLTGEALMAVLLGHAQSATRAQSAIYSGAQLELAHLRWCQVPLEC